MDNSILPFLKRKDAPASGLIIKTRAPDEKPEQDKNEPSAAHEACARDLLKAIEAKDVPGIAAALYDAFTVMESEPHEEAEHSPHTYDAQNQKAGQEQE